MGNSITCRSHRWAVTECTSRVRTYRKRDKTYYNVYLGMSLLSTTYKIISKFLLSRLTPYAEETIGDNQYGFRRNRSATGRIFCVCHIPEKNWNIMSQCISYLYEGWNFNFGYKNCWSDAPMQQEGCVLPLPAYIMGAVHHEMGIRSSQLIVSRCRDSV